MADELNLQPDILYYSPNELRGGLPALLVAKPLPLPLDYGWVASEGQVILVEHKTMKDLAQSLRNGQLADQLEKAKRQTPYLNLVVTGLPIPTQPPSPPVELMCLDDTGESFLPGEWLFSSFLSAVVAVVQGLQVIGPIYSIGKAQTALVIQTLFTQTRRESLGRGRPTLEKWRKTKSYDQVEAYARALRGIGWQRAEALASIAPTWAQLTQVFRTDRGRQKIRALPGFGEIMVRRVAAQVLEGKFE